MGGVCVVAARLLHRLQLGVLGLRIRKEGDVRMESQVRAERCPTLLKDYYGLMAGSLGTEHLGRQDVHLSC